MGRYSRSVPVLLLSGTFCLLVVCCCVGQELEPPAAPKPSSTIVPKVTPKTPQKRATEAAPKPKRPTQPPAEPKATQPPKDKEKKAPPKALPPEPLPLPRPPRERDDWFDPSTLLASRGPIVRLASVPNMFGDAAGYTLQVCDFSGCGAIDLPPPGGGRGTLKISENDKAMPMDRVFFSYNHFHNALDTFNSGFPVGSLPIDQYTIGGEKTFCDGLCSLELRLPLNAIPYYADSEFNVDNGHLGNLAVTFKQLLLLTETTAVAAGLGVDAPTGSDTAGQGVNSTYVIRNNAVHLSPFLGLLTMPNDRYFLQGFLQVDLATNGNQVIFGGQDLGDLHEQTLLYVDLSIGYWLHRNPRGCLITGIAPVLEYHYSSTLQNADIVTGYDGYQVLSYGNIYNRLDISNITAGVHTELGKTTVRVGGVFPLRTGSNRSFDAEVQVSINRQF